MDLAKRHGEPGNRKPETCKDQITRAIVLRGRQAGKMVDDITTAVLEHEEVARYLRGTHGQTGQALERINGYLDELRTTQRYPFYRALKHPLYPILRKIERRYERVDIPKAATTAGRVVYVSNHKSHTDYLIEPLALDDNGIRPPIIAAGINLFGGPLGLLHRHVTGAIPIRRNTKDPAYLITLKAYVAELLRRHDLLFYIEGGRSYSGELKPPKTGLVQATLQAGCPDLVIVPTAIAYDIVLEDRILARQGVKRRQRPFSQELAEMVGQAVGYRSRAFVTFGEPIPAREYDGQSRRSALDLAQRTRSAIGLQYKVLPTALVAAAMRPSLTRRDLEVRVEALLGRLVVAGANLGVDDAREAVDDGVRRLSARGVLVTAQGKIRVRDRIPLRYYARTIAHLLDASDDDKA
jgi:1-acyl-sn-glycerol-3-phosphate acyltransferase